MYPMCPELLLAGKHANKNTCTHNRIESERVSEIRKLAKLLKVFLVSGLSRGSQMAIPSRLHLRLLLLIVVVVVVSGCG